MWNDKYISYWSSEWDYAMAHTDNFCAEIRSKAAVDEHAENSARSYDETMGKNLARVEIAMDAIKKRGYMSEGMTALDIGSGTGVFTIAFAKEYAAVTALDISPAMQGIIRQKADREGLLNIEYTMQNWHSLDLRAAGMESRYDMVLSSLNTRGIYNFDTLIKMNNASRGGCCLVSFTGRGRRNHSGELHDLIIGRRLGSAGGNDIIMPFNLIYNMGGKPDMAYSEITWERELSPKQAIDGIAEQFWRFAEITTETRAKIENYVLTHLEQNGMYLEAARVPVAIMVWDSQPVRDYLANE